MECQQLARDFSRNWKEQGVDNQVPRGSTGCSETSKFVSSNDRAVYGDSR